MQTVVMIGIAVLCNAFGVFVLIGVMLEKGAEIFNPIRKQETKTDYAFWDVTFEKTRSMNLGS